MTKRDMTTRTLDLHSMTSADHLVHPEEFSDVNLHSPAVTLFTDFRHHEPIVIDSWMGAVDAERHMQSSHTRLRLVVDPRGEFVGTITLNDLSERNVIRKVAAGESRYSIRVADLMTHRHELRAIAYEDLRKSTVQSVIDTLSSSGERHCLVVDFDSHAIRGLIAASDVARRLHMNVFINPAPTFSEIFDVLHDGKDPRAASAVR